MALKDDKIKDLFSSKLGSFEPEVPASIWGGLDQLLSQQPPVQTPDSSSSTNGSSSGAKASTLKTVLLAAGVAASVATGVFFVYHSSEKLEVPGIVEEVKPKKAAQTLLIQEDAPLDMLVQAEFVRSVSVVGIDISEDEEQIEEVSEETKSEAIPDVKVKVNMLETLAIDEVEKLPPLPLPKFFKEDLSLSLRSNAGALASDVNHSGGDLLFSKDTRSTEFTDLLRDEDKDYKLAHKQPISVGLTVSKKLARNFSLETGLMFTYLSSKITSNSAVNLKEEQTFGYLGVPIYLNYNFYELSKVKFYLSLGVMMQKDIFGRYTSELINRKDILESGDLGSAQNVIYSEPTYIKEKISQSHWQFSSHLTAGVSYPVYRKLHIYTSIGGAYYFDANNEYRTVFSDRKFQLDLNLGLRVDF